MAKYNIIISKLYQIEVLILNIFDKNAIVKKTKEDVIIMNKNSELVLGIIQTVGTNSQEIINCIVDSLKKFHYNAEIIKVSKQVLQDFADSSKKINSEFERISYYMDLGNNIRKQTQDGAILMKGVAAYIYRNYRFDKGDGPREREAYIIDSIKHPAEVAFLRKTYGDGFHLIGISDSYDRRKNFLTQRKDLSDAEAIEILKRDDNETDKNGQHTRDAYQQADYFIDAGGDQQEIQASVFRLLDLLFGNSFISPTFDEYAMFRSYVASLRSADLSRQIGAVVTKDNEILAEGVNDCPKAFGGLYWPIYQNGEYTDIKNGRDYTLGYDSNKIEQINIIENILKALDIELTEDNKNKVKAAGIGTLTEYGRVVHSEMEALLMCSRNNISTRGCNMYVTTFPCHNCAKHIIAAGIKKVVYIEPYPKSKALDFYKNEITQNKDDKEKVQFIPFNGVGPHRFIDLFSMNSTKWYARERKDKNGYKIEWEREKANLRNPMSLLNYIEMEKSAYKQFTEEIQAIKEENRNE